MCAAPDCPVADQPPPGEHWCIYRLGLEMARHLWGYPMRAGTPQHVTLTPREATNG